MNDNSKPSLLASFSAENIVRENQLVQADYTLNRNFFKLLNGGIEGALVGLLLAPFTKSPRRTIILTAGIGIGYYLRESYSEWVIFSSLNNPARWGVPQYINPQKPEQI